MSGFIVNGATIKCDQGIPCSAVLIVLRTARVTACDMPFATIIDFKPMAHIPTLGISNSSSNPAFFAPTL